MKTTKDGKVKLEKGEVRVGNFFIRIDGEHVKATDLNSCFTFRVSRRMPLGIWLENMLKMGVEAHGTLHTWCGWMWSFLSVVPDREMVVAVMDAVEANLARHPEWYGYGSADDEAADEEAAREVREIGEFEQALKDLEAEGSDEDR